MQKNAYLLAKIGADTAENERIFAENDFRKVRIKIEKLEFEQNPF